MSNESFNAKDVATLAIIGAIGYVLYKAIKSITKSPLAQSAGAGIANIITWATEPPAMKTTYSFLLPDGSRIDPATVNIVDGVNGGNPTFTRNGINYIVRSRDDISGDYICDFASLDDIMKVYGP